MIQVYVGEGKGKTTASIGLSVRAAGHGFKVLFIQFLKDGTSGEISVLNSIPEIEVIYSQINYGFVFQMTEEQKNELAVEYAKLIDIAIASDAFLIVLDEVIPALNAGLVSREMVEKLFEKDCEIALTGRNAPDWMIEKADYVSDINKIRHPFDIGVKARIGIEY